MSDEAPQPEAERVKPRGEAGYKAHLQKIAESNDRARAAGQRERREREERAAAQRRAEERRMDAELARNFDSR
jgi:hypothetical protein